MPEIPNVVSGEPVESQWGNAIRDRVAQRYADATARDAETPIPGLGELAWLDNPAELTICVDENGPVWETIPTVVYTEGRYVKLAGDTMTGQLRIVGENVVTEGSSLGLFLIPTPGTNTDDWRVIATADGLLMQSRQSGSFGNQLVIGNPSGSVLITQPGTVAEPALQFANSGAGIVRLPGDLMGLVSASTERVRIGGTGLEVLPSNDLRMTGGTGNARLRYTSASAGIQADNDAAWVGSGDNRQLYVMTSAADEDPVVAAFAGEPGYAAMAAGDEGPTSRDLIRMLVHEITELRSRLDALEA